MIDTHCHLTSRQLADRTDAILTDARSAGVRGVISVAIDVDDAAAALRLAHAHEHVWCTAGVHPLSAGTTVDWERLAEIASDARCVAWGELGLDNHYEDPPRAAQDTLLSEHLAFIESADDPARPRPIVVHCRQAVDELLAAFRAAPFDPSRYVFHCFTGDRREITRILDFGAWVSFTGAVTFKNGREIAEAARVVPDDRIMVETDAPYMTPEPMRKIRPNEPQYVVHVAEFLADLRGMAREEFDRLTDANAERCYGITLPPR